MPTSASHPPIAVLTHEFHPQRGGIATVTEEMACAAAALGHAVEAWVPAAPPGNVEKPWPFRLRRLPVRGTHGLACQIRMAWELWKARHRLREAIVYIPEPGPMLALMALQFFRAVPSRRLILTFHGSEILRFHRRPVTRHLTRSLLRQAERASVLTNFTRELLLSRFPEAAGKIVVTAGALRADYATVPPARKMPAERIVILTVGRLHPRKGQLQTLRALQVLPEELRSLIEYRIAGSGNRPAYEKALRQAAAASDVAVRFLGDLDDGQLAAAYGEADIFALTSINHGDSVEGFGLVYLEAAAHGLPVIAHNVGGVREAVLDGVTGVLVTPERPDELTAAFARLIDDPALRAKLGEAGRAWSRRNSWTAAASLLFHTPAHS